MSNNLTSNCELLNQFPDLKQQLQYVHSSIDRVFNFHYDGAYPPVSTAVVTQRLAYVNRKVDQAFELHYKFAERAAVETSGFTAYATAREFYRNQAYSLAELSANVADAVKEAAL
jgi:hypothetical protein